MCVEIIFHDSFHHANPHPGNLLMPQDSIVGVLDCSMVGCVNEQLRKDFKGMLLAGGCQEDAADLTNWCMDRLGSVSPDFDHDTLRTEIGEFLMDFVGQSAGLGSHSLPVVRCC